MATESTFRTMTVEHLGSEATAGDLTSFVRACENVLRSSDFDRDDEAATDFVWNHGEIRFDADTCSYCERAIADNTVVPACDDDAGWGELAPSHADDCEWITTRAQRRQKVFNLLAV
jgi:ferredoxin